MTAGAAVEDRADAGVAVGGPRPPVSLYLCYFGLREPLVQTQVLPYLRQLAAAGVSVRLLTFEPELRSRWTPDESARWAERLRAEGIAWSAMAYHKRPSLPATMYDILVGGLAAAAAVRRHGVDVVHARAHVAAVMGSVARALTGCKLVFDVRGFNPEEYVDAGVWRAGGFKFRLAKEMERWPLAAADGFVVLTERARDLLFPGADASGADRRGRPVEVIPCCVDLTRFEGVAGADKGSLKKALGLDGRRVLVYVGALGGFYLTDETASLMAAAHRDDPSTFCLVLTQSPPEMIAEPLRRLGVPEGAYRVAHVPPSEVPGYVGAADAALSLIKPSYSKQASSPTKVAEYLAAGVPVVCNAGVGDLDGFVEGDGVGVLLGGFGDADYRDALERIRRLADDPSTPGRCRACASERFDLIGVGGRRYRRLYARVLGRPLPLTPRTDGACDHPERPPA